jgi:uncharacterized protein (TIGR02466 family)
MIDTELKIESWNPTFIGYVDNPEHSKIEKKLVEHCLKLKNKIKSGGDNWISKSTYNTDDTYNIINDKKFKSLNDWIVKNVKEYSLKLKYKNNFLCKEAWFNVYKKYDYQEFHNHPSFTLSAVYFLKSSEKDARIFFNLDPFSDANKPEIDPDFFITSSMIHYDPVPGRLLIFRSNLLHCVERQESNDLRISLAYNFKKEI